jgi:hypothetical protein
LIAAKSIGTNPHNWFGPTQLLHFCRIIAPPAQEKLTPGPNLMLQRGS